MERYGLLIIDPNNGFLVNKNYTPGLPGGHMNLYIPGGEDSAKNMAKLIEQGKDVWASIKITLDSHHPAHIAKPMWWLDKKGRHPDPFTMISLDEIRAGEWRAAKAGLQKESVAYVEELERLGRYKLIVWPPHCIIGTEGACVESQIRNSLFNWESKFGVVRWKTKGSNPFREHYSGLRAEVPYPSDPETFLDVDFIKEIEDPTISKWFVGGWASSHCLKFTVDTITENASDIALLSKKLVMLRDCTLPVPGFEKQSEEFFSNVSNLGIEISNSTEVL